MSKFLLVPVGSIGPPFLGFRRGLLDLCLLVSVGVIGPPPLGPSFLGFRVSLLYLRLLVGVGIFWAFFPSWNVKH